MTFSNMLDLTTVVCSLVFLSIISIILNGFSIYVMIKSNKKFHERPSSVLVMNLLLIHMFQAVIVFPLYAGKKLNRDKEWKQFFSSGFLFTYILSFYGACFATLSISIDRFLATYLLTRYRTYATFKNTMYAIALAWTYVVLLCLIPFMPESTSRDESIDIRISTGAVNSKLMPDSQTSTDSRITKDGANEFRGLVDKEKERRIGSYLADDIYTVISKPTNASILALQEKSGKPYIYTPQKGWTVFMLFFNAALPLGIIVSCYVYIIYRLKELAKLQLQIKKDKEVDRYKQVTIFTLVLAATYTLCWSPSIIYYTMLNMCEHICFSSHWDNSFAEKHIVYVIKYLSFMNATFSPFIYCLHQKPEVEKRLSQLRRTFSKRKVTPPGNFDSYNVAMRETNLDGITVTVYQTSDNKTEASNLDDM